MTDPTPLLAEHLTLCDAEPFAVLGETGLDRALAASDPDTVARAALRLCLAHPGPLRDARLVMSHAATVASDAELVALARKLWQAHFPHDPDVFFHAANAARLLARASIDRLVEAFPSGEDANLDTAFGLAAVLAAQREGRELPEEAIPLLRRGLKRVNRLDETLLCEILHGPWDRVWPEPRARPWLFCAQVPTIDFEVFGAFETVALAIFADRGDALVERWLSATTAADRARYAAALAWGVPLHRAGAVLATLAERSWRERQSLLHGLVRHGDALLPALDTALAEAPTRAIAARLWVELPPTEAVLARTAQVRPGNEEATERRLSMEANPRVGEAKIDRTRDPLPVARQMLQAYLRAGRNFTEAVLAPAHAALDAGDRAGLQAAWLLFESAIVTDAPHPSHAGFSDPWRRFVERSTSDLAGLVHLARALLAFPTREAIEHEGASAILWASAAVDDVLSSLLAQDPPPWALLE